MAEGGSVRARIFALKIETSQALHAQAAAALYGRAGSAAAVLALCRSAFIIRYSGSDSNVVVPRTIGDAVVRYVGGFISNRDVQTITIPNTVVRLNGQAFNHCKKLEQVILEESSRLIFPAGVFRGCPRLNMPPNGID